MDVDADIFITAVARPAREHEVDSTTFLYDSMRYKKLLDWNDFDVLFDLRKNTGFYLKLHNINESKHLVLCYTQKGGKTLYFSERQEKLFLINSFFEKFNDDQSVCEELQLGKKPINKGRMLALEEFYEILRVAHENDDLKTSIPSNIQHPRLRPILRPYQVRGIKWMLKRELMVEHLPDFNIKIRSKFNKSQIFYFNKISEQLSNKCPEPIAAPSGGLLTDEMGLGKTVEVIGLMLMNPRRAGIKRKLELTEESEENTSAPTPLVIKCICHKKKSQGNLIMCKLCSTSQHVDCVFQQEMTEEDRSDYKCPFCWKTTEEIIDSSTTIIVMPSSIKAQWKDEFSRHIADKSFKTLIYNGISSGWVSPTELIKYNAIITDFNTLSKELYFSERTSQDRLLRHNRRFEYPPSPLTSVRWWRVVLDEAQMVENKNNRPSQMVAQLPAVHRWATTGTPVEKNSICCLYGLVFFLNLQPYTDERLFDCLFNEYRLGNPEAMIKVLSTVMWRTCKKNVEHEINIPKQTEIMHQVEMTSLQEYFYRQVHVSTKPLFMKNMLAYLSRNAPFQVPNGPVTERVIDLTMKNKFLYQLNNATLKIFLEPLRKLRQDCTIPSIFHQNDQVRVRQTLRPEQLHDHLVTKTSIETKSALRTVCSSINGIAAIKISENKFGEAVGLYKQVLKLATEYTTFVAVDSMLQIHAYQGLIDIATTTELKEDTEHYTNEMGRLEWKYASSYYEKVKEINKEMAEHSPELRRTARELTDTDGHWWRYIMQQTRGQEQRLMDIINLEVFSAVTDNSQILEQLRSSRGIQLIITEWCDKIQKYLRDVKKRFSNLNFIVTNLRPLSDMNADERSKVQDLAKAALNCHLHLFDEDNEDDSRSAQKSKRKGFCELCKLKAKLNEYECVLFNKSLIDDITEGTWNPRFEEKLLKAIWIYAKRSNFDDETIEMGKNFFNHLEALKTQFKLQAKLWVEVNYTVSAFDELNMCKMRMEVVATPDEITDEDARFKLKIARYEVDGQLQVFVEQRQEAEINFVRLNGRLKYLEHLKERNEPQSCPICTLQPKERYYVTVCGHSICAECFSMMIKKRTVSISCPVCRTIQEVKNVYAVVLGANHSEPITGSLSPKIDEIIRSILRLRNAEPDVKILIFSHWDQILQSIAIGLELNSINYRASFKSNFTKQIKDFKDFTQDITCLMLNLKFGGKGLNLIEATHVFLVEPILNADEELQAIGRVHRIGQMRETFVHRFICKKTIEETIYNKIIREKETWIRKKFSIKDLEDLLNVELDEADDDDDDVQT